jgi:uncharacterized ferredoxin-like protein
MEGDEPMSILFEEGIREKAIMTVAEKMLVAARTAPKGRGVDNLVAAVVEKEDIPKIADRMKSMVEEGKAAESFIRDANNILQAEALVLLGTRIKPLGLKYCGNCGFKNCEEKNSSPNIPCSFNTGDLGIAIGSAVSVAMDARVDNRIMYTVGIAVKEMELLGDDVKIIYGIPLSCSSKNPFFDRKQ